MPQTEPTKIIQYSLRRQKRAKKGKEAHWVSIHPRIGYGWTCWIRSEFPNTDNVQWWVHHHITNVIHHDDKSGVVVTEDAIYLPG